MGMKFPSPWQMDELEQLKTQILARKIAQNERRIKKGLKPRHKIPVKKVARKASKGKSSLPPIPEGMDMEDTALSFDEWKGAGWSVKKGERSHCTDALGQPQFLANQVRRINPAWEAYRKKNL